MWWMAIPALISAASSIYGYTQQKAAAGQQAQWARYNADMGFNTSLGNVAARNELAMVNAKMAMAAGEVQAEALQGAAQFNADVIHATTLYNDLLLEEDLALNWEALGLDLKLLEQQRAQERGAIIANQAASGTVINEGSNLDVIISQRTQEELDAFVTMHNADIRAAQIMNTRAQNLWQGEMQARKAIWEGNLGASVAMANANLSALGQMANAFISGRAETTSAMYKLQSDLYGAQFGLSAANQQAVNGLTQGLFSSMGQAVSSYYSAKTPSVTQPGSSLLASDVGTMYDPNYVGYNQPR